MCRYRICPASNVGGKQGGEGEYDANRMATRQEMRSFVCGQCHVEYYFKGEGKLVTYPWDNGLQVEQIEAYYNEVGHKDWTHKTSGANVLKAQHPEFEMWSQGIHARSGVACADCHMPYKREGAIKVSDHHIRSPLLNVAAACQTCHNFPEDEMKGACGNDPRSHRRADEPRRRGRGRPDSRPGTGANRRHSCRAIGNRAGIAT